MGLSNAIGLVLGTSLIVMAIALGGFDKVALFIDYPSILIVSGGTVASVLVAYPLMPVLRMDRYIKITFTAKERNPLKVIEQIVALSESARREGLLSLENHLEDIDDNPFLATGIRMAVDGMSPEVVESIMNTEMEAVDTRHAYGKGVISKLGQYSPAFGMIGTLIGLVLMLADLDPDTIGAGMAVALLTTLYGAIVSNLVFLPWADKLQLIHNEELMGMEITLRGVIAIQSGENPRIIKQKLMMYLPPTKRPVETEEM
ncbi:MAG: MotA/TolQ/ExbB proton channel family protein [Planctomycetaceae bacterium]|nr:MotA/TolQ/ExbB proton channel family protein [Planctomycetaceae bacterium]